MTAYAKKSDLELAAFIVQGNDQAFSELVSRHTDRFFALAYRTLQNQGDAEDVVQAAFIKFWQRPQLWNSDKSKFTTWFYRVIINACHDLRRRGVKQKSLEVTLAQETISSVSSEEQGIEKRQAERWRKNCIESGIRSLPAAQRDALNLVVYCEVAQKEAAEILGIKLKALESVLYRAKRNLIEHVEKASTERSATLAPLNQQLEKVANEKS